MEEKLYTAKQVVTIMLCELTNFKQYATSKEHEELFGEVMMKIKRQDAEVLCFEHTEPLSIDKSGNEIL